jgi:protein O-mannosyl-transferase
MTAARARDPRFSSTPRWSILAVLVIAVIAAYANTFHAPFIFDDGPAIPDNPTIRHLWPLSAVLLPPGGGGLTVAGRPVLNLSLALNYVVSGTTPWSYHVFNTLVHAGSALLLFGIVRRTAQRQITNASGLALTIAAVWALHPLQTEAITYTVQRAESLMTFFYLLTVYAFVRAAEKEPARGGWLALSVIACLLGTATKEVIATAPLLVLVFDRTFVGGSFRSAWRERKSYYLALASSWVLLAALLASTGGNRGGTVGLGVGVPLWAYPLTQVQALVRYIGLMVWPQPLIFEYGQFWVQRATDILPYAAILVPLLMGTIVALWRWPIVGFLGAATFGILAPTSLAPGTIQMIVEHRAYLAIAGVVTLAALTLDRVVGKRAVIAGSLIGLALLSLTVRRNQDYQSALSIWSDTVAKRPGNSRAREALADALAAAGRLDDAIAQRREAVRLKPEESTFHYNLGVSLAQAGRFGEAAAAYSAAEHLQPSVAQFHYAHAKTLVRLGRMPEAITDFEQALALRPDYADAHADLASALVSVGHFGDAITHYESALRSRPNDAELRSNYGLALLLAGRAAEAISAFRTALELDPEAVASRFGLANALAETGRREEAIATYEDVLRRAPAHADAHFKLGNMLMQADRVPAAEAQYQATLKLNPQDAEAHHNLGIAYVRLRRYGEAKAEFETALRLKPDYTDAQRHLQQVNALSGAQP